MKITEMSIDDIDSVVPLYIDYYNNIENGTWTEETAKKRIRQVAGMSGAYCLILKEDDGETLGFVMGYFKQYDDIVGYTLEEIVIAYRHQNKGLGSILMRELEKRAARHGAACIELQAVKDEMHERYYGKHGFKDADNFVLKVKWL